MKRLLIVMAVFIALFSLAGCKNAKKAKLYIYNWTYYTPQEVIEGFQEKFNCEVVYDEFPSNEEMYAKLKAGGSGYDIVFPSGDYVSIMKKENMLEKLDRSKIPNFANIDVSVLAKIAFDIGNDYSIPYMMGASGILVNKKYVKDYSKDMSIFERSDLKGKMTLLDDMREVMGFALKDLGYSVNTTDVAELEKARDLVQKWKKNIQKFDSEAFGKAFAAEEFYVVQGYEEVVFSELDAEKAKDVDFFIPTKGAPMYIDSMVIPKDAANKELAYQFINYIHEPEVYAKFVDIFYFPSINVPARSVRKNTPKYDMKDLVNCELKEDIGDNIELYNKMWQEIRIGN